MDFNRYIPLNQILPETPNIINISSNYELNVQNMKMRAKDKGDLRLSVVLIVGFTFLTLIPLYLMNPAFSFD